jgi:hypothetical protein
MQFYLNVTAFAIEQATAGLNDIYYAKQQG